MMFHPKIISDVAPKKKRQKVIIFTTIYCSCMWEHTSCFICVACECVSLAGGTMASIVLQLATCHRVIKSEHEK